VLDEYFIESGGWGRTTHGAEFGGSNSVATVDP
jgi:hypothetical protein